MDLSYLLPSTSDVNGKSIPQTKPTECSPNLNYNTSSPSFYHPWSSYTNYITPSINRDLLSSSTFHGQLTSNGPTASSIDINPSTLQCPSPTVSSSPAVTPSSPAVTPSSSSSPPSSSPLQYPLPRSTEQHLPSSISPWSSSPPSYLYKTPASSSTSYPSSSPSSYTSTPDKEVGNMNDSGNSSGLSSDSSPLSQSSDISLPTTSPTSSPVLPNSTSSSPEETRVKKNSRTNYSPKQVRCLEKIFLETPYPEPDLMEQLSRDLGIPEKNLKIWFQNKRARWRKRVQNNKPTFPPVYPCYPAPVPSTVSAYSMMSPSSLMSPVVAPQVASRSAYNLPSTTSTPVNKPTHQLYSTQFPSYTYNSYMLPPY